MALINKVLPGYVATMWMQDEANPTPLTDAQLSTWTAQVANLIGTSAAMLTVPSEVSLGPVGVGSTQQVTVQCNQDVSAKTLVVVAETMPVKTDVATVADGSITKSTTTVTFNLVSAMTSAERTLRLTVRDTTTKEIYASVRLFVTYDAQGD